MVRILTQNAAGNQDVEKDFAVLAVVVLFGSALVQPLAERFQSAFCYQRAGSGAAILLRAAGRFCSRGWDLAVRAAAFGPGDNVADAGYDRVPESGRVVLLLLIPFAGFDALTL